MEPFGCATRRRAVRRGTRLGRQQGFAMLAVLMLLLLAMTLGAATMLYTTLDVKSTQHYSTGNRAFAASEAGLIDVINTINTRGVVNVQTDVVNSGLISTAVTSVAGYPNDTYQVTSLVSGTNAATQAYVTMKGMGLLSAERLIKVGLQRGPLSYGPGALHLSNDSAAGSFAGNSMIIDGNNYNVTDIVPNPPLATLDATVPPRPAISTRNDTVNSQVVTSLAGLGTIVGVGTPPSVWTTNAASTADLQRFVNDILAANGAPAGCNLTGGGLDYWMPGPCSSGPPGAQCGVHCVKQTNGNSNNPHQDLWGTMAVPNVTYVLDTSAKLVGGSYGAGILIFTGGVAFGGNFNFCGWVLFLDPTANGGVSLQGTPTIYGEVLTPLAAFTGGGSIIIRYSQNCLNIADSAGINGGGNLPHPVSVLSWAEQ